MPDKEQIAFEPFASLDNVLSGGPIKIMPLGTFYRDSRKLEITEGDLKEIEKNTADGLPRFRIPINENHQGVGKVGTVNEVKYMSAGEDGPGLYATNYELTDEGRKLVETKRFDAVSPEVIWKKNGGATYQDPQTGKQHNGVIVGLALTDRPFFGHDNVALFSDTMPSLTPPPKRNNGFTKLKATLKEKLNAWLNELKDDDEDGQIDELPQVMPMTATIVESAPAELNSVSTAPAPAPADNQQGVDMADQIPTPAPAAPDKFSISAEEFAALKAKADKVEAIELASAKQAEAFAAQLKETKERADKIERAAKLSQMKAHCEEFSAVPLQASDLADKFMALEEKDADLFKYFDGLLTTLDNQIAQAGLFGQVSNTRQSVSVDTYEGLTEKVLKEKFGGDRAKYEEAANLAASERPDLFAEYSKSYTVRRKGE